MKLLPVVIVFVALALPSPMQAAVELRYERIFELEGRGSGQNGTMTISIEGDEARYDSSMGRFFYAGGAQRLTHVRPDDKAVVFDLPIRYARIATPKQLEKLASFRQVVDGETEVRTTDRTRTIAGHRARLIELVTVRHVGGRIETQLWVASPRKIEVEPLIELLRGVDELMVGLEPWMGYVVAEGLLPLEIVTTTEGNGPHRKETLRLVSVDEVKTLPADRFEVPEGVDLVEFDFDQYFRVHR